MRVLDGAVDPYLNLALRDVPASLVPDALAKQAKIDVERGTFRNRITIEQPKTNVVLPIQRYITALLATAGWAALAIGGML